MAENRRNIRPKTKREEEIENKPRCLWDPLDQNWCNFFSFPPPEKQCESCLMECIGEALAFRVGSDAMRYFLAYRNFLKSQIPKKSP